MPHVNDGEAAPSRRKVALAASRSSAYVPSMELPATAEGVTVSRLQTLEAGPHTRACVGDCGCIGGPHARMMNSAVSGHDQ